MADVISTWNLALDKLSNVSEDERDYHIRYMGRITGLKPARIEAILRSQSKPTQKESGLISSYLGVLKR